MHLHSLNYGVKLTPFLPIDFVQDLSLYSTPTGWRCGSPVQRILWIPFCRPLVASWIPGTFWRHILLRLFGASIGSGGRIKPRVCITAPWNLTIGDHCWLGEELWIDNLAKVVIGDHVCLSQGAYLCTGNHDFRSGQFDLRLGPITVHSQAWIAAQSVLGPGVTVGAGAIVSLGAVALADVPAYSIVRGNPAAVINQR